MIKKFFKHIPIIFLIFFFHPVDASNNKIVVKINKKIISSYEIRNKINTEIILRNLEINQTNIDRFKNFALQELINFRIKEDEILKYNVIDLSKVDITNQLNNLSSNNIEKLKKKFSVNNLNYDIFLKELKIQAAWQNLIFFLYNDKVKIDENEVVNEFENFKKSVKEIKEYDLSELELSFKDSNDRDKKIKEINKNINEIGFEKSVSIYSESDTALNNGRLGFVNEKSLSRKIFELLKNLNEGDVSQPIIQLDKILYLKVNKIRLANNEEMDTELIKNNIINKRKNDLFNLYSKSHMSKLKNNSYIEFK